MSYLLTAEERSAVSEVREWNGELADWMAEELVFYSLRTVAKILRAAADIASADTHPKGEDAQQASSPMGSAVAEGETPND